MLKIKNCLIDKDQILYITKNQGKNPLIEVAFITGKCIGICFEDEKTRDKEFEKLLEKVNNDED